MALNKDSLWICLSLIIFLAVLGIHDILVRIRIRRSIPMTNGSSQDPTPDPTSFFSDFKDAKKIIFFHIFFLTTYLWHIIFSLKKFNFLHKFSVKILFCKHYFSPLNTFVRIGKDPDPYWIQIRIQEAQKHADLYPQNTAF
jgi:hypothetical protein